MSPEAGAERARHDPNAGAAGIAVVALRWALSLVAIAVVVQAGLGFAGRLAAAPAVVMLAAGMTGAVVLRRRWRRPARNPAALAADDHTAKPWTRADLACAAALAAAIIERAWAGLHRTTFLYDVLSYHLHLPATWRAAGAVFVVPTPFGDPAPAYAPANAELMYHLMLALTGNAVLAHAGQVPFAALAALAIHAGARELGVRRAVGLAAATAFLLVPEVWQQAPTAMADLVLAAFFLSAIPFLLRLGRARAWTDVVGLGLALGLLVGTKYVAAAIALPVVAWTGIVLLPRRRPGLSRAWAAAIIAALALGCGGFWYARNLLVAGNPLFPVTLRLGPVTLARGLYDVETMRTWAYHVPRGDLQALLQIFTDSGWAFVAAILIAVVIVAVDARRSIWPALVAVATALVWLVVPYQQSRFFFSVWGLACLMLAAAATRAPRAGAVALALATVGSIIEFPTPGRLAVLAAAALGAVAGPRLASVLAPRRREHPRAFAAAGVTIGAVMLFGCWAWARASSRASVDTTDYAVGDAHDDGWAWIRGHAHGAHIAYAGSNLPLPLWGPRFENRVAYVNVSGRVGAPLHEFRDVVLAQPTAEPAPERAHPDLATWLANLDAAGIELLFVVALYPIVRESVAHDDDGFPIERAWADAYPDRFSPAFAQDGVRIYRVRRAAIAGATGAPR